MATPRYILAGSTPPYRRRRTTTIPYRLISSSAITTPTACCVRQLRKCTDNTLSAFWVDAQVAVPSYWRDTGTNLCYYTQDEDLPVDCLTAKDNVTGVLATAGSCASCSEPPAPCCCPHPPNTDPEIFPYDPDGCSCGGSFARPASAYTVGGIGALDLIVTDPTVAGPYVTSTDPVWGGGVEFQAGSSPGCDWLDHWDANALALPYMTGQSIGSSGGGQALVGARLFLNVITDIDGNPLECYWLLEIFGFVNALSGGTTTNVAWCGRKDTGCSPVGTYTFFTGTCVDPGYGTTTTTLTVS